MFLSLLLLARVQSSVETSASCSSFEDCSNCLGEGLFCGWCSPSATIFDNGTVGSRCQDQHAVDWHCSGIYSTATCLPGYACNIATGTCDITAPGKGTTKEDCEKSCTKRPPAPPGLVQCDAKSSTCVPCQFYCKTDADCASSSYCEAGLCHGAACESQATCTEQCSTDTPDELIGTWRGVEISTKYGAGEFDYSFVKKADVSATVPQVRFRSASGAISSGTLEADRAASGRDITITFDAGAMKGIVLRGFYDPWEPSDEVENDAFVFSAPNAEEKPADITAAMAANGSTVYVMSRCAPHAMATCDFASVWTASPKHRRLELGMKNSDSVEKQVEVNDPCTTLTPCSTCIAAPSKLCGWCSTNVVYNGTTTGSQCAGFDASGKPLDWTCNGTFSKSGCADYGCDWTDIKHPKCTVCSTPQCTLTKTGCDKACVAPPMLFKCNDVTKKCDECASKYCTKDADCPGSYCQITGAGPWSCHGAVPGACTLEQACTSTCGAAAEFYTCDSWNGQCREANASTPGATTKWLCDHGCNRTEPLSTWRGVEISKGFTVGEVDFTFFNDGSLHWRSPTGMVTTASVQGVTLPNAETGTTAITGMTKQPPLRAFNGIFKIDTMGDDGFASLMTWADVSAPAVVTDFTQGMGGAGPTAREFILHDCRKQTGGSAVPCDFTASAVP